MSITQRWAVTAVLAVMLILAGCKSNDPSPPPAPAKAKPNFVTPTAEQAYRLQDDCSRRGEKILQDNLIGSALTQEQVARYNATTNRCYVRLNVHAADINKWREFENATYLKDGQTGELLAYMVISAGGGESYLGFGCDDARCVSEKISACMAGKECEPD